MKKISVLIPCYNEQENVEAISKAVLETLTRDLPQYDYELVFIDNDSTADARSCADSARRTRRSRPSSMPAISDSSTLRITVCCR